MQTKPVGKMCVGVAIAVAVVLKCGVVRAADGAVVDRLDFGASASEKRHSLQWTLSEIVPKGLLGASARRLFPPEGTADNDWQGGSVRFTLAVDPQKQNYFTARFSGSDISASRLILFIDGKQVGYRHLGDIDILDFGSEGNGGGYPGRFYYNTSPLPVTMTRGKMSLACEIRSTGRTYGYAGDFKGYQKPMTEPTRGIYAVYTHTDPSFTPPPDEAQGKPPSMMTVRQQPGVEVIQAVKQRVNDTVNGLVRSAKPLNQVQLHLLARAYQVKWSVAYQNPQAIDQLIRGFDALLVSYENDPKLAQSDPAVYNGGWFGLGMMGDALRLTAAAMGDQLDKPAAGTVTVRRAGWSKMLQDSRDWHRAHRRLYTNQTMINDMNVYRANRGVAAIDPSQAMPDDQAKRYLYESLGMQPWRDSDDVAGIPSEKWSVGDRYMQLTAKGLTKELGYVGYYGEVIDWATQIYDATRDPGQEGDPKIKAQVERIAAARAVFRYPAPDNDGNRAMRIETIIGWRDMHYPGDIVYGERPSWDSTPLYSAAAVLDDKSIGYARQMIDDNQLFDALATSLKDGSLRVTAGLLGAPDQYEAVLNRQVSQSMPKLPMTPGEPDFVFSDEDDGVVAIKNGSDIFYASLYWRARYGINSLARVHYMTATTDHIATVFEDVKFTPSGQTVKRADWTNFGFGGGGPKYPGDLHSAFAGEAMPISKMPAGVKFKSGDESVFAGRGDFYTLRYGPYLIGMNCTDDRPHELTVPSGETFVDLSTGKPVAAEKLAVGPKSTRVLYVRP